MFKLSKLSLAILGAGAVAVTSAGAPVFAQTSPASDSSSLEEIVVTGIKSSYKSALDRKRNASGIQDSIVAEDIGKFPDQNVAESLQRVPGVSISRVNGEGSKVTVRGFGPAFNMVKLNGRTLATTTTSRDFDFQILPSELIGGADVVKSPTASTSEGSVGALVDINTARPLDSSGFKLAGSVDFKHNDLAGDTGTRFSGVFSNTFADDTLGVLIGVSHQDGDNRIDETERNRWSVVNPSAITGPIRDTAGNVVNPSLLRYPGRHMLTVGQEARERTAVNAVIQFAPNDATTHTLDYLQTDFSRKVTTSGLQIPLQYAGWKDVIASPNLTVLGATKFGRQPIDGMIQRLGEESDMSALGYNFEGNFDGYSVNFDASLSQADSAPREDTLVPNIVDGDINNPNAFIQFNTVGTDVLDFNSSIDVSDPGSVRSHWNQVKHRELSDEILDLKLDVNFELNHDTFQSVDVGLFSTSREKSVDHFQTKSGCGGTCGGKLDLDDGIFNSAAFSDFLSEEGGNFPRTFVTVDSVEAYLAAESALRGDDFPRETKRDTASTKTTEDTQGLYAQLNFAKDAWKGNVGLRYVETETGSTGHGRNRLSIVPDLDGSGELKLITTYSVPGTITRSKEYDNFLPSLNLSYDLNENMVWRFAAAKTISRPSVGDIGVNRGASDRFAGSFSSKGGNPDLDPYEVTQFDLSFNYYKDNGSAYGVNLFHKDIDTFISTLTFQDATPDVFVGGEFRDTTVNVPGFGQLIETITQKENRTGGVVSGIELSALHYFDELPGIWSGLGVQANYTYANSKDKNAAPIGLVGVREPDSGLEGFAKNSYNLVLFYDKGPIEARLAYNYRDTFLKSRTGFITRGLPEHVEEYGQLDFRISYDINDRYSVSFDGINLTNERLREFADIDERMTRIQYTGARYSVGLRGKF